MIRKVVSFPTALYRAAVRHFHRREYREAPEILQNLTKSKKIVLFAAATLILATLFQWILEWTFFSNASSQAAMSFTRTSPLVTDVFGQIRDIKVVRLTDYGNAAKNRRERKYVLSVAGTAASGTVVVVDTAPNSGHRYEIDEVDAYQRSE